MSDIWLNLSNSTNGTQFATVLGVNGYLALNVLSLLVLCPLQLVLNSLVIAAVSISPQFKKMVAQRSVLLHLFTTGLVTSVALIVFSSVAVMLLAGVEKEIVVELCRIGQLFAYTGILARNILWLTFSIVFFMIIRYGHQKIKKNRLIAGLVVIWLVVALFAIPYLTPAYTYTFVLDGVICLPRSTPPTTSFVHLALSSFLFGIPTHFVLAFFTIATFIYIRNNTITEDAHAKKATARFAGWILVVTFTTLLVNLIGAMPYALRSDATLEVLVGLTLFSRYFVLTLPAFLTPVFTLIIYRPIRRAFWQIISCACVKKKLWGSTLTMPLLLQTHKRFPPKLP